MAEDEVHKVTLNIFDISEGYACELTEQQSEIIEGIWHTSMAVYGNEYYFLVDIRGLPVGTTPYGTPTRVVELGVTHLPKEVFEHYLQGIRSHYNCDTYRSLTYNCNNFSNDVANFLVGSSIPEYILQFPNELQKNPMASELISILREMEGKLRLHAFYEAARLTPDSVKTDNEATESSPSKLPDPTIDVPAAVEPAMAETVPAVADPVEFENDVTSLLQLEVILRMHASYEDSQFTPPNYMDQTSVKPVTEAACLQDPRDAVEAAAAETLPALVDPLEEIERKVTEDITREFEAVIVTGGLLLRKVEERLNGEETEAALVDPLEEASEEETIPAMVDPLEEIERRVVEDIAREFEAVMETGGMHQNEAVPFLLRKLMKWLNAEATMPVLVDPLEEASEEETILALVAPLEEASEEGQGGDYPME